MMAHEGLVTVDLARSPLAHGMLSGTWTKEREFAEGDHRQDRWTRLELERRTAPEIPALLQDVNDRRLDGLLIATSPDSATLHVAMVAAALLWRDICPPSARPARAQASRPQPVAAPL